MTKPKTGSAAPAEKTKTEKRTPNPGIDPITITHPEKRLSRNSDITKGDVAGYYRSIAKRMLPHIENRILSTVRCPKGVDSACFYKKHPTGDNSGVVSVTVPSSKGDGEEYFYIRDIAGLLFEVQMNTVEFHTWGSRVESLENPDIMVLDLDPDEGMDLQAIRRGVTDLRGILEQLSLASFLKTSGGKGYHVVIPLKPTASWDNFHAFARTIAKTMETNWPDRYTSNARKAQRSNRIYVDWLRTARGATSIAPYSIRAREGLPVSMPISWKELDTVAPADIDMKNALARMRRKDPWDGFFSRTQDLQ